MIVRVLYLDGCPNHTPAVELVKCVAKEARVAATVKKSKCETSKRKGFSMYQRKLNAAVCVGLLLVAGCVASPS